jgi:acyl phosphate:glycerol-3-phosphate acyltransferase
MIRIFFWCLPVAAYLLGSIPWGMVFARIFFGIDIRKKGSGNIGATNVGRVAGLKAGILTLFADAVKGTLPVFAALFMDVPVNWPEGLYPALVASAAFLGHLYPVFLRFKGGKGVATAAGCFLVLSPKAVLFSTVLFGIVSGFTRKASAGSLTAAVALPLLVWITARHWVFFACAVFFAGMIIGRHSGNIRRLLSRTEPKFRAGKG